MAHQEVASLTLTSHDAASATFHVHDEDKKDDNEDLKWVTVIGYDADDVPLSQGSAGVQWPKDGDGHPLDDADVTVAKNVTPGLEPDHFRAYVWVFPASGGPRSNIVEF